MTVVAGTRDDTGDRIVGVMAGKSSGDYDDEDLLPKVSLKESNLQVYEHSAAKIGKGIQDQDALNTMIAAFTGIHCTAPRVEGVGGAKDSMVSGKVVVLGGNDYACFAAEGLAALGSQVSLISTNKVKVQNDNVEVLPPVVGDDEIGFASFIGDFDSLLDTADDERPSRMPVGYDSGNDDAMAAMGTTLRLLKQRHNCERYISSMTKAQSIVNKEGVLFGPGKVKKHFQQVQQQVKSRPATFESIVPPPLFGKTVETLLDKGIVYKNNKDFLSENNNNVVLRGWSLNAFMETSMWPSDSSGGGTRAVRFGFPVVEEEENEFTMIAEPPSVSEMISSKSEDEDEKENPYVQKIVGSQGLYETVVKEKRDCVLFLSATFCRTCKTLNPRFTSLARRSMEEDNVYSINDDNFDGILFAKADTGGKVGKELGRLLNVKAVPAFLCFRGGRRFGPTLSISRIPSKKLEAAIEMLESGSEWDTSVIVEAEEKQK
ncbi:expressed unknown protein [Seminavis robusta]|uniref:Thioredoxin domain-containing protein n=1 Tax=Seminavis robusta TaxID=568900 RepID=A0A9N8HPP8_9STRA|nr:expressed unknown protein [Seminavis robusta]|eukprot:Sro1113_g242700.1 n/a (488) ;mRNA; r:26590-28155